MIARKLIRLFLIAPAIVLLAPPGGAAAQEVKMTVEGATVVVPSPDGTPMVVGRPPSMPSPGPVPGAISPPAAKAQDPKKPEGADKDPSKPDAEQGKPDEKKEGGKEKEAPKPVVRESDPPEPPDPKELQVRPDEEGLLEFNFSGQRWPAVLQWLADVSEMSLDWQELPGDYLNLTTQRKYTVAETRDLINRHLLARGYTLLEQGEILSVAKIDKINPALVPRVAPEDLDARSTNEYVKVSFRLGWLLAEEMVEQLKPMLSPNGKLAALTTTNRLEAMDAVENLRQIRDLLAEEQSGDDEARLIRVFPLKHTRAEVVVEQLMSLLGIETKKAPPGPVSPDQMRAQQEAMRQAMEQAKQQAQGAAAKRDKPEVYLVADKRHNTILANAPPDKMAIIAEAIEAVDVPSGRTQTLAANLLRMHVYRLESIQPEALIKTLEELGDLDFQTRLEPDRENKAILAYAPLADHVTIESLVSKLDRGGRRAEVIPLNELRAESVAKVIDFMMGGGKQEPTEDRSRERSFPFFFPFNRPSTRGSETHEDRFRVDADVKNNSLLLWCNDFELAKVEKLLENLRQHQRIGDDPNVVKVHRLISIDPKSLVKTLQQMEVLDFHSTLEIDEENGSIIAYASEADQARIAELIETLDGSMREFHVVPLRRLNAEYVAGTIAFMMAGKEDEQQSSGYSRTYVYNEYYGGGPSRGKEKKPDEFRVDADLEYNRLLLWANDIEVKEVENLLVKLGEIPPKGGDPATIRVLDLVPGPERDRLLEQIRRAWPSIAPNQLLLPPDEKTEEKEKAEEKAKSDVPKEDRQPDESPVAAAAGGSVFRLAQLQQQAGPGANASGEPGARSPSASAGAQSPEEDSTPDPGQSAATPPARRSPISIAESPDGRLVISSEDTAALDRLEDLIAQLAPPRRDYKVFKLKYAEAYWVSLNLEDYFETEKKGASTEEVWWSGWYGAPVNTGGSGGDRRLSRRRPLRFISDDQTNTILVQGASPDQLRTVEDLIELYDQPPTTDSESTRRTEVFPIRYSKAEVVAETVKEVYRDLLSERDKSLGGRKEKDRQEPRPTYFYGPATSGDEGADRKMPRWKGYLSIGVDELSNTLIVSAPEFLFRDVERLIKQLDESARPTDAVYVLPMGRAVSAEGMQSVLSKVLGEAAAGRKPGAKTDEKPAPPGPANGPPPAPND